MRVRWRKRVLAFFAVPILTITFIILSRVYLLFDDDGATLRSLFSQLHHQTAKEHRRLAISVQEAKKVLVIKRQKQERVLVISGTDGRRPFANATRRQLQAYCEYRNYDLFYFAEPLNPRLSPWWQKIWAITLMLTENLNETLFDVIAWFDDDCFVTNFEYRLESFFNLPATISDRSIEFIITVDTEDDPYQFLNSGAFLLRTSEPMRRFFEAVLAKYDSSPFLRWHPFHDQSAIIWTYYEQLVGRTLLLPMCVLQSFDIIWSTDDFLMHVSGLSVELKTKYLDWMATHRVGDYETYPRMWQPGQCTGLRRAQWEP